MCDSLVNGPSRLPREPTHQEKQNCSANDFKLLRFVWFAGPLCPLGDSESNQNNKTHRLLPSLLPQLILLCPANPLPNARPDLRSAPACTILQRRCRYQLIWTLFALYVKPQIRYCITGRALGRRTALDAVHPPGSAHPKRRQQLPH